MFQLNLLFLFFVGSATPSPFPNPTNFPTPYLDPRNIGYALYSDLYTYIETEFQSINRRIVYDRKYYMDPIAGKYATCAYPNGYQTGNGMVDTDLNSQYGVIVEGRPNVSYDIEIISRTVKDIVSGWIDRKSGYYDQIMKADKFGCSFHPECSRNTPEIVLSCAFHTTGEIGSSIYSPNPIESTNPRPTPHISTTSTWHLWTSKPQPWISSSQSLTGSTGRRPQPSAYAFTKELRKVAEDLFGQHWDDSRYLENLSAGAATCKMAVSQSDHFFDDVKESSSEAGVVDGFSYSGLATGRTTEEDVEHIVKDSLLHFPLQVPARDRYNNFGCSILPDCYFNERQYVVISCLFLRK